MFRAILWSQWKWSRGYLLFSALASVLLVIGVLRGQMSFDGAGEYLIPELLNRSRTFGVFFQLHAAAVALGLALATWNSDTRTQHVYALLLPVARAQYVTWRFAAGLFLLALPAVFLAGVTAAGGWIVPIPNVLHVYSVGFALRWFVAAATVYAVLFAIVSASPRIVKVLLYGMLLTLVLDLLYGATMDHAHRPMLFSVIQWLFSPRSPYAPFLEGWMLIDV